MSELFECVRPKWNVEIDDQHHMNFFAHFSTPNLLDISDDYKCVGTCTKIISKVDLIGINRHLYIKNRTGAC